MHFSYLLSSVHYFVQSVLKTIPSRIELFFFYMWFSSGPLHIVTLFGFNVSFSLLQSDSVDDPYQRFLAGQRKREIEWKAARKSKKVKVSAPIPAPMIIETGSESGVTAEDPSIGSYNPEKAGYMDMQLSPANALRTRNTYMSYLPCVC